MIEIFNENVKPGSRFDVKIEQVLPDGNRVLFHRVDLKAFLLFGMSGRDLELGPVWVGQAGNKPDVFFLAAKMSSNLDQLFASSGMTENWEMVKKLRDDRYGKNTNS